MVLHFGGTRHKNREVDYTELDEKKKPLLMARVGHDLAASGIVFSGGWQFLKNGKSHSIETTSGNSL